MKTLIVLLVVTIPVFGEDIEPKAERSKFDMKQLRDFINFGLSTTQSRGSLRKVGEPTRKVRGRVVDHEGKPIAGAIVSLSAEIGYSFHQYDENFDMTDDQGRFVVEGDHTRERIVVWRDQSRAWHKYVTHNEDKLTIRWPAPAQCMVTIDKALLDDESFGENKLWLTTTHYAVGMSTLHQSVDINPDGPTVIENLLPGEYSVRMKRRLTLEGEPAEARGFSIEVARFKVGPGEKATVRAAFQGKRSITGAYTPPAVKKGAKSVPAMKLPKSMFVEVREQKLAYDHVTQLLDACVTGDGHSFQTRPLPPGRYVISLVGPTPKATNNPPGAGGFRFGGGPSTLKLKYRVVVPEDDKPIVLQFPPADSLERRIQQTLDTDGQRNVSWSYLDVQAAQVGREVDSTKTVLQMLEDPHTPNSWQYPLIKSLNAKLGEEEIVREVIRIAKATKDEKLRNYLVTQLLRMSKILREEIADAVEPFRKDKGFRTRHLSYSTMSVHVTEENRERVIPWMIEGLSDPYPRTRYDMAAWLGRVKANRAVPELERISRNDPSGAVRVTAAHAVAQITGEQKRAVQVMTVRLRHDTYCGQWEAAQLLSEYKDLPEITIKALLAKVKTVKGPYGTVEKYEDNRISRTAKRTLEKVAPGRVPVIEKKKK